MKGRSVQYHSNISKDEGRIFYEKFITLCEVFYFYLVKVVEYGEWKSLHQSLYSVSLVWNVLA